MLRGKTTLIPVVPPCIKATIDDFYGLAVRTLTLLLLMAALPVSALEAPKVSIAFEVSDYTSIDVDQMIKLRAKPGDKRRYFIKPAPVRFSAMLMQLPTAGQFELVYESLSAWGVSPLPEVGHASYLKTSGGQVIPVYLEKQAANFITANMAERQLAEFYALHIYDYEKGPRFLIVSVAQSSEKQNSEKQSLVK